MAQNDKIQLFEDKRIRTAWDEEKEEWYFSIVDVVTVLTDQPDQRGASNYWAKLKQRLKEEGADQLLTNCQQLKMKSPKDGKRYNTDVADIEQLLRIIQSIPSPKAEPFKLWLAQVGRERIEETILTDEISRAWSGMSTRQYKNLKGLKVAGRTRKDIASQSDTPVITTKNAAQLNQVVTDLLEGAVSGTTEKPKDK